MGVVMENEENLKKKNQTESSNNNNLSTYSKLFRRKSHEVIRKFQDTSSEFISKVQGKPRQNTLIMSDIYSESEIIAQTQDHFKKFKDLIKTGESNPKGRVFNNVGQEVFPPFIHGKFINYTKLHTATKPYENHAAYKDWVIELFVAFKQYLNVILPLTEEFLKENAVKALPENNFFSYLYALSELYLEKIDLVFPNSNSSVHDEKYLQNKHNRELGFTILNQLTKTFSDLEYNTNWVNLLVNEKFLDKFLDCIFELHYLKLYSEIAHEKSSPKIIASITPAHISSLDSGQIYQKKEEMEKMITETAKQILAELNFKTSNSGGLQETTDFSPNPPF